MSRVETEKRSEKNERKRNPALVREYQRQFAGSGKERRSSLGLECALKLQEAVSREKEHLHRDD